MSVVPSVSHEKPLTVSSPRATAKPVREIWITWLTLVFTLAVFVLVTKELGQLLLEQISHHDYLVVFELVVFSAIVTFLVYGNVVYQMTRIGYFRRLAQHTPESTTTLERFYDMPAAPTLAVLVPSYKEDANVVRLTLLSAALQDYPHRRVTLLVDDPPHPKQAADQKILAESRALSLELQTLFDGMRERFAVAAHDYRARREAGSAVSVADARAAAQLYRQAAAWLNELAQRYCGDDHVGRFIRARVFESQSASHVQRAAELECMTHADGARLDHEYHRLSALFRVEFHSFERKRYINLSHEANKAMNLNSYLALMGQSLHEVLRHDGLHLETTSVANASFVVPDADYVITLDADSIIMPDYAPRLIHHLQAAGNERVAVAQTPYSAFPGAPGVLERVGGATTDIQYNIHQGFTYYGGTYWVGANALLRKRALDDIRETDQERGYTIHRFIQDRTVIEDTESSVDLIARGWQLYNYPERLAYSATPPDFGSLLIQRRRWANGGLIILPKLLRYLSTRLHKRGKLAEGFLRTHYLVSISVVNIGLLIMLAVPFDERIESMWLPLTAAPYFFLYARDLMQLGYRLSDLLRVYALNLLLIPVNLGGVFKSIQQAITRCKIPFGRTPKVVGRTAAPAWYVIAEYALLLQWLVGAAVDAYHQRWALVAFCLVNAAFLAYAIYTFIGLRASVEDIAAGFEKRPAAVAAQATAG